MSGIRENSCVKIEELAILPTAEQNFTSVYICQMLSNYFRNIEVFRFNERTSEIYIFAGEELQSIVSSNRRWRFVNEA